MRELLTADDLYSEILLERDQAQRAIIVVEGDSDCSVIDPHINTEDAQTMPAHGKINASQLYSILQERPQPGVAFVLDSDWIGVSTKSTSLPDVVYSQNYDLDVDVAVCGSGVTRILHSHCDRQLLSGFKAVHGDPFDVCVRFAAHIGAIRLLSYENDWNLSMDNFPVNAVAHSRHPQVDTHRLAVVAVGRSRNAKINVSYVQKAVEREIATPRVHLLRLCNGHDLAATISWLARTHLGAKCGASAVESAIRAAASCNEVANTRAFVEIEKWGSAIGRRVWTCRESGE